MFHGQPISDRKLKEVLGHSPLQVLAGAVLGVFIGILYMHMFGSGYAVLAQGTSYLRS
jgi:acid phosphatase family membrane protein YuiD